MGMNGGYNPPEGGGGGSGHDPVTLGSPNGLELLDQELSLKIADGSGPGALSDIDWIRFDASDHNPVTLDNANGLELMDQELSLNIADGGQSGALSDIDWIRFDASEALSHDPVTLGTPNGLELTGQDLSLDIANGGHPGALSATDWVRFNALELLSKQVTQTIFVDCCRIDSYVADGSRFRPFKSLVAAINYRAGEGYDPDQPWVIILAAGLYIEDNSGPEGIILPTYTGINGQGIDKVILQSTTWAEDFFTTPLDTDYEGCMNNLTIRSENGDNDGKGLRVDPKAATGGTRNQLMYLTNIHISGFDEGIKLEEFGTWIKANFLFLTECQTGIENDDARFWGSTVDIRWTDLGTQAKEGIQCEDGEGKCEIYNLNIDGNFKQGIDVDDGGEVHAWNVRIDNCERGLQVGDRGEIKIEGIKIKDAVESIRMYDKDTKVFLNDADLKVTTINKFEIESRLIIRGRYPSRKDCTTLGNIALISGFLRTEEYDNFLFETLIDLSQIDVLSNVTFSSGKITLEDVSVGISWENLDSIANWSEVSYTTDAVLSLDTIDFYKGTGSMKIDYNTHGTSGIYRYMIRRNLLITEDWSSFDSLRFWAKSSCVGSKIRVYVRNSLPYAGSYFYHTFSTTGWELITLDLTLLSNRNTIGYFYIYFTQEAANYIVNIDDMQVYPTSIYQTSGYIETKTINPVDDREFFEFLAMTDFEIEPLITNVTWDVSLDNGSHWLTDVGEQDFLNDWRQTIPGGVYEFADGGVPWNNIKNFKVKVNLITTDISVTPKVNKFGCIWRVDKA